MKCDKCYTDIQVEVRRMRNEKLALVITTWQNIGNLATPFDAKWTCRFQYHSNHTVSFECGSIKESFETIQSQRVLPFDREFTDEVEAALVAKY
jgi:hypothetical protein